MPVPSRPKLLSPAGDRDALRAAVANGADAVYFGLADFNARHRATNFTLAELPEVMQYLHEHGVRGYVTFNTLIFSDELPEAARQLAAIVEAGADAVIMQDLGAVELLRRLAPGFPIHGSTQMTLTEPRGIEFVRRLGVERVILARELSLAEIGRIARATPTPVEVFVHGALCIAYSGQCLTSEAIGGRSANRGQCAQACRQPYELIVDGQCRDLGDKAYLLSPQDLAAYDRIAELAGLGVACLKIEGRLKSAHYVAATTQTYRAALDAAGAGLSFVATPQQELDLAQSFSRGFTHGFLDGVNHQRLVEGRFPKNRGVRVGTVVDVRGSGVLVALDEKLARAQRAAKGQPEALPIRAGDGIVFDEGRPEQDEQGGRLFGVRLVPPEAPSLETIAPRRARFSRVGDPGYHPDVPSFGTNPGRRAAGVSPSVSTPEIDSPLIELEFGRGDINFKAVSIGAIVWKTDDPALRRRLERSFENNKPQQRVPLNFEARAVAGQPLRLTVRDDQGMAVDVFSDAPLATAVKHPLTLDLLREQLDRLGGTPYRLASLRLLDGDRETEALPVMVPKSVLNALRRRAVAHLTSRRQGAAQVRPVNANALDELRAELDERRRAGAGGLRDAFKPDAPAAARLSVLCRTVEQLEGLVEWSPPEGGPALELVYCDFEDVRRSKAAVARCRAAGLPVVLATPRIVKPREDGLLLQIARCRPDGVLVRNLAAIGFYRERFPELPLYGDYALNITNELTADLFSRTGLVRLTPGYDLNFSQLETLLARFCAVPFEVVLHQHMPMFHMEHCVFSHVLSNGKDFHDCGRPCDRHQVELRDHVGEAHPLVADVGCRNTVFNARAQSAATFVPRLIEEGVRHFRVELLREDGRGSQTLVTAYSRCLAGLEPPPRIASELRVLTGVGVTCGTLAFE
ncbi:MAG: DUF3656 domain-containing U32 family peptidase [Planctomycetaceae bacterium]